MAARASRRSELAVTAVLGPLLLLALMLFAAAALSPRLVPWPGVAAELDAHRFDLTLMAFGVLGVTFAAYVALFVVQDLTP